MAQCELWDSEVCKVEGFRTSCSCLTQLQGVYLTQLQMSPDSCQAGCSPRPEWVIGRMLRGGGGPRSSGPDLLSPLCKRSHLQDACAFCWETQTY